MMDKEILNVQKKILALTTEIEEKFPELYVKLDETPYTIPNESHPHLLKEMQDYYDYLQTELTKYKELHGIK